MGQESKKSIWSNGWTIAIGSALISGVGLKTIDHFADTKLWNGLWDFIKNIFIAIGSFFGKTFVLARWEIILLPLSPIALFFLVAVINSIFDKNKAVIDRLSFLTYTADTFDGILYKWEYEKNRYNSNKFTIINYESYCPDDNCIILNHLCPICHKHYPYIKNNSELEVLIRHRIDNNLFKK